jgi:hypothetical protein
MSRNNIGKVMTGLALRRLVALLMKEENTVSIALMETNNEIETLITIIEIVVIIALIKIVISKIAILDLFYED